MQGMHAAQHQNISSTGPCLSCTQLLPLLPDTTKCSDCWCSCCYWPKCFSQFLILNNSATQTGADMLWNRKNHILLHHELDFVKSMMENMILEMQTSESWVQEFLCRNLVMWCPFAKLHGKSIHQSTGSPIDLQRCLKLEPTLCWCRMLLARLHGQLCWSMQKMCFWSDISSPKICTKRPFSLQLIQPQEGKHLGSFQLCNKGTQREAQLLCSIQALVGLLL